MAQKRQVYPLSSEVIAFPTANRDPAFDPQSRSMTEENITNISKAITSYHSYVISETKESSPFEFVIDGYYFAIFNIEKFWEEGSEYIEDNGLWAIVHTYSPTFDSNQTINEGNYHIEIGEIKTRDEQRRRELEQKNGKFHRNMFIQLSGKDNENTYVNPQTKEELSLYTGISFTNEKPSAEDCCKSLWLLDADGNVPPESRYIFTSDVIDMDILDCGVVDSTTGEVYVPTPTDEGASKTKCVSEGTCTDK